jgi:GLPGLI family protein
MKKIIFTGISLCFLGSLFAQMKEGKIVYERTSQTQIRMGGGGTPPGMSEEMMNRIPRSRITTFELSFANNQTLWQQKEEQNQQSQNFGGGDRGGSGGMQMRFMSMGGGTEDVVYTNLSEGKIISKKALGVDDYLVSDSVKKLSWKLTGETQEVAGYNCRKATAQRIGTRMEMKMLNGKMESSEVADTSNFVAWFTTDIPVSTGPELQGQLPGAILELNINNGRTVYKAVSVTDQIKAADIKEPKGGKKVTSAQYAKKREQFMEETRANMQQGQGQGGNRTIIMNH